MKLYCKSVISVKDNKNRSLGMGLHGLLGMERSSEGIIEIDLERITPNKMQPRKIFENEELMQLASSIKEHGLIQPILVRSIDENSNYEIIAGERRFRACKYIGLKSIKCIIQKEDIDDLRSMEIAIIENIQREQLNPIEEAEAYKCLSDKFNMLQNEIAAKVGKSRSHVANMLRIASMNEDVKNFIIQNKITPGHAKAVASSENPLELLKDVVEKKITVREVENRFKKEKMNNNDFSKEDVLLLSEKIELSKKTKEIQNSLMKMYNMKVSFNIKKKLSNNSDLEIFFENTESLDSFIKILLDKY